MGKRRTWAAIALLGLGAGFAPPAAAEPETEAERVRRLEDVLERQTKALERLRADFDRYRTENPARATPTADEIQDAVDSYLASARAIPASLGGGASRGLRLGGYLTLEYLDNSDSHTRFDLHRLILAAEGDVTEHVDFAMELEVEHGGISDEIQGEIKLEKAEVRFRCCDSLVPKAGWLLIPFGRYNLNHDDPINDFTIRPFTARFLVPTGLGQPGVGVEGSMPFGAGHVFSYDAALTNGFRDEFTASGGTGPARQARDNNDGKQVWGRASALWNTGCFLDVLETGVSGTYGIYDDDNDDTITGFALDAILRKGPFELKGEYVRYDIERGSDDPPDAIEGQEGLWVEAGWHFFPDWFCGSRGSCLVTDTSLFTLCARYQWMDLDDDRDGAAFEDDLRAWSVGLNYRVTEECVLRVDHTWFDAEEADDRTEWTFSISTYF